MTLTDEKKKKIALIVVAALVAIHFAPNVWNTVYRAWAARNPPPPMVKPSPGSIAPAVPQGRAQTAPPPSSSSDASFAGLLGIWRGDAIMPNNQMCHVSLELKQSPDKPGGYTGYSVQNCGPTIPLAAHQYSNARLPSDIARQLAPVSTILSGTVEKGDMHLQFEKTITTDPNGCQPTSYVLTPFAEGLGAQFERGPCAGGKLVMRRSQR